MTRFILTVALWAFPPTALIVFVRWLCTGKVKKL